MPGVRLAPGLPQFSAAGACITPSATDAARLGLASLGARSFSYGGTCLQPSRTLYSSQDCKPGTVVAVQAPPSSHDAPPNGQYTYSHETASSNVLYKCLTSGVPGQGRSVLFVPRCAYAAAPAPTPPFRQISGRCKNMITSAEECISAVTALQAREGPLYLNLNLKPGIRDSFQLDLQGVRYDPPGCCCPMPLSGFR